MDTQTNTPVSPLRTITSRKLGPAEPGFLGAGHTAIEVITADSLARTDPFVLLMDDRVDFAPGRQLGGAHPHAGLETVTFVLEGTIDDRDEGKLFTGDVAWMTAGRGVVHSESVYSTGRARILQLWVTLPERARAAEPRLDVLRRDEMPVYRSTGVEARLYSGHSNGIAASTMNHVPVTLVDVRLEPGARFEQELPASYNGFVLPIAGSVRVGESSESVRTGEIGWLDRREDGATKTVLRLTAGDVPAHVMLYAGERQNEPTVQYGPFVAGSYPAIERMHREYRAGRFVPISVLARSGKA